MITIRDLLWGDIVLPSFPKPSNDPLSVVDGFYEAILLDTSYVPHLDSMMLIFDFRSSLSFDLEENTGILICRNVRGIKMSNLSPSKKIHVIGSSKLLNQPEGGCHLQFVDMFQSTMEVLANTITFYSGYVDGIGEVAASIESEQLKTFHNTIPTINSEINIISISKKHCTG